MAIVSLLLVHVPPPASLRIIVAPTHKVEGPEIGDGKGLTVTVLVTAQPEPGV